MKALRRLLRWFRDREGNETVDAQLRQMMPGMLIEQAAAVLLANVNVFVMRFISTEALAGVGQISTVNSICMNLVQAFAIGGTAETARLAGAGRPEEAAEAAGSALKLGFLVSGLLTLGLFGLQKPLILLLFGSAQEEVLGYSLAYFRFTSLAPVLWFLYFQCCGLMRSVGDTRTPMLISVTLNSLNLLLNLAFALIFRLGVQGSALAYLLSVAAGAALGLGLICRKGLIRRTRFGSEKKRELQRIAAISFPAMAENLMFNGNRVVLQIFLAGMGTVMISANQVFNSVNEILMVPFMALYSLTVPLMGSRAGSGDRRVVRTAMEHLYRRAMGWGFYTGIAHLLLCLPVSFLFTQDPAVLRIAVHMLLIFAVISPLQSGCFVLPNGFKAVGDARFAMFFSSATAWGIRVFGTWLLGVQCGLGVYAIIITQGLDYLVRAAVYRRRSRGNQWLRQVSSTRQTEGQIC